MKYLVTGAAGFIGSHVCEALLWRGDEVVAVDNFDPFYSVEIKKRNIAEFALRPGCHFFGDSVDNVSLYENLIDADTTVIHLAALAGVRPSLKHAERYVRVNVGGTTAVLEAAVARGATRFILASSSSVYGNALTIRLHEGLPLTPISPYAATKGAAELMCEAYAGLYGMRVMALRFFTVYGPRQRPDLAITKFARAIVKGEPITLFGDGSTVRDYTWIDDAVAGVLRACDWAREGAPAFEAVNIGGEYGVVLSDLVRRLGDALGAEPIVKHEPEQPGDVRKTLAHLDKARRLLGYEPKVGIGEGITRFAAWLRAQA